MTSHSCLCCFNNLRPVYLSISLLVANAVGVIFLIWGVVEMVWSKKYARAIYWVGFIILIIALVLAIIILIFTIIRNQQNLESTRIVGKILCIVIIGLVSLAGIFTLIGSLITFVDYVKYTNEVNSFLGVNINTFHLPGKWWATLIVPEVITLIVTVTMILCARALYIIFNERILNTITENEVNAGIAKTLQYNRNIIIPDQTHNDTSNPINNKNNSNNGLYLNQNNMNNNKEANK